MSEILYFTHFTTIENFISILKKGYLYTNIERIQNKIKYEGVASAAAKEKMVYKDKHFSGEFPGIYLSYITDNDLKSNIMYWGNVQLVFSKKLLEQKNYHINIVDNNGRISENITYFHSNLDKMPKMKDVEKFYKDIHDSYPGNEIVFHDKVSLSSLCEIWVRNKKNYNILMEKLPEKYKELVKIKRKYSKRVNCPKNIELDKKSLPFLLSLDYRRSTYADELYPYKTKKISSKTFFKKMAMLANISEKDIDKYDLTNPKKLDKYLIRKKLYSYYHSNRDKQNLDVFNK